MRGPHGCRAMEHCTALRAQRRQRQQQQQQERQCWPRLQPPGLPKPQGFTCCVWNRPITRPFINTRRRSGTNTKCVSSTRQPTAGGTQRGGGRSARVDCCRRASCCSEAASSAHDGPSGHICSPAQHAKHATAPTALHEPCCFVGQHHSKPAAGALIYELEHEAVSACAGSKQRHGLVGAAQAPANRAEASPPLVRQRHRQHHGPPSSP